MTTRICRAAIALGSLLSACAAGAQDTATLSAEQLFEQVAPSVWTVRTADAQGKPLAGGSAVVIGPGSLVTNCHVLARSQAIAVVRDNVSYGAVLDQRDPERDLCLLKVRNFDAPAARVGSPEELKTGARVYAIGSPRGLEQTISDGLLSGIRRTGDGSFVALQVTVPISPGSSGGGLFDARGRLVGITTFQLREAQNINFALPASWIAEIPRRAQAVVAGRTQGQSVASLLQAPAANADMRGVPPSARQGQVFEYRLQDRLTNQVRNVSYRLERIEGDRLIFNGGSRIETSGGGVVVTGSPIGGEFDLAMPPGGWLAKEPAPGAVWNLKFQREDGSVGLNVRARTVGEAMLQFEGQPLRTLQVEFKGFTTRSTNPNNPAGPYRALAWYAPELGRIVRFEVRTRGGSNTYAFVVNEVLELVDIRQE